MAQRGERILPVDRGPYDVPFCLEQGLEQLPRIFVVFDDQDVLAGARKHLPCLSTATTRTISGRVMTYKIARGNRASCDIARRQPAETE